MLLGRLTDYRNRIVAELGLDDVVVPRTFSSRTQNSDARFYFCTTRSMLPMLQ